MSERGAITKESLDAQNEMPPTRRFALELIVLVAFVVAAMFVQYLFLHAGQVRAQQSADRGVLILHKIEEQQKAEAIVLTKVNEVVRGLQHADQDRTCLAQANSHAFSTILSLLADNFVTPPAPDPDRLAAVQGLRDAAASFAKPPAPCS